MMSLTNPTFNDMVTKHGTQMYSGIDIDDATKASLLEWFKYMKVSDANTDKWIWMWRRNLAMHICTYNQELDMWKTYREEEWFYDKIKVNNKEHTETTTLTEDIKRKIERGLSKTFEEIYNGIIGSTGSGESSTSGSTSGESHSTTDETSNSSGKDRAFAFNYPESNYSGGVIPYDLNNNPSVEFISTQADTLRQSSSDANSETESNESGTSTEDYNYTNKSDTTDDRTTNQTGSENENTDGTENRDQTIENRYTDHYNHDGSNIIDLAHKMIELIPASNFFLELTKHLEKLFVHIYDEDEIMCDYF